MKNEDFVVPLHAEKERVNKIEKGITIKNHLKL